MSSSTAASSRRWRVATLRSCWGSPPLATSLHDCRRPGGRAPAWVCPSEAVGLADDVALDLARAGVDRHRQRLADEVLHLVLARVACAAHHLHPLEGCSARRLGGLQLRHRRLPRKLSIRLRLGSPRHVIYEQSCALELRGQVSESVSERLKGADRLPELLTLLDVRQHVVERPASEAD